jgi:hypothetical protein
MSTIRLGPVTFLDLESIKELLNKNQVPFEQFTTEEKMDELMDANKERHPSQYAPRYDGPAQMVFLEIPEEAENLVRPLMIKLGYWHEHISDGSELEGEDYFCPRCSYHSEKMGICPTHHLQMVEYSDWKALQDKNQFASQRVVILVVLLTMLALIFVGYLKH